MQKSVTDKQSISSSLKTKKNKANTKRKKTSAKDKIKTSKIPKVSYLVKPETMTLEEWQTALRRQVAETDKFEIRPYPDKERKGYFLVKRPIFKKTTLTASQNAKPRIIGYTAEHTVIYRGEHSKYNYCECLDFKTSGLGTCKHLEAVKKWLNDNNKRIITRNPDYSSIYVDYHDERKIKIRIGQDKNEEIKSLASSYFDAQGNLLDYHGHQFYDFFNKALSINPTFKCYPDVWNRLNEIRSKDDLANLEKEVDDSLLNNLLKATLYPYQKEGIRFAFRHGKSIIADEMGLGKTIQAIGAAELFKKFRCVTSVLIVCPTSLKYQWKHEIEKFTDSSVEVVEGNLLKRKTIYETSNAFYKIVSYNAMANDIKAFGKLNTDLLILDEVQRLKNWDTQISKAARKIKSPYRVILSGTPLENKLEELYSIVELIDQFFLGPYYLFRNNCIVTDSAGMTIGYKNLSSLNIKLKEVMIRRKKSDVKLQMPQRMDKTLYVTMTKKQKELHDDLQYNVLVLVNKWRRFHFLSEHDRQRLMLLLSQMRMVANSTFILDQQSRHDTKIEELMNILIQIFEAGDEKVVIFSGWERMTRIIAAELKKMNIEFSNLNGSVPSEKRKHLVDNFNNNPECRVFLSTDAGATGLNLQAGSIIINMELPWNPAILEQRIGRIYRLGQRNNIQVINMVSQGSIEMDIETKIQFKAALFEGALDNVNDTVFLPEKKQFDQLMESLDKITPAEEVKADTGHVTELDESDEESETNTDNPCETIDNLNNLNQNIDDDNSSIEETATIEPEQDKPLSTLQHDTNDLVANGLGIIGKIVETLKSPDKTKKLVDNLVKTDKATGKSSLEIPVPNKKAVTDFLSALGNLFS